MSRIEQCFLNLAAAIINENCDDEKFLKSTWGQTLRNYCGITDDKKPEFSNAHYNAKKCAERDRIKAFVMPQDQTLVEFIW